MRTNKWIKKFNEADEYMEPADAINKSDDYDEQNYEFAKWIFQKEEGRRPNMNNENDMRAVSMIEVGVRWTRDHDFSIRNLNSGL